MKKISMVLLMILIILITSILAFTSYTNYKTALAETEKQNSELSSLIDEMKESNYDPLFWTSSKRIAKMVSQALERNKVVLVDYRLLIEGKTYILDGFEISIAGNGDVFREFATAELVYGLANENIVKDAHASGKLVEVTGVIIKWREKKHWFSRDMTDFSACELDSEEGWDYACVGKLEFFGMPHVISVEYEVKGVELNLLSNVEDEKTLSELRARALK